MKTLHSKRFSEDMGALTARFEAQKIAFGPVVFQCARIARDSGMLASLDTADAGLSIAELAARHHFSEYAVSVLMETCLSAGLVRLENERYLLEKTGYFIARDHLTQINMNYIQDVCYLGLNDLEESLKTAKPAGLKHLGPWSSIYEGLSALPEPARTAWFEFDHYYSDSAFPDALPHVLADQPRRIMDIGANTGKWALHCLQSAPQAQLTLLDLPIQLEQARNTLSQAGLLERAHLHAIDLLDTEAAFPAGQNAVWMSQFLSCFSKDMITSIFKRAASCLAEGGAVYVLDTFWDRQQHDVAAYCLINTSPYFTTMASGCSKMYRASDYIACADKAGLKLADIRDNLGICHSLLKFVA